jgi:nucleotide-binding universal stress UspA family protein
MSTVLRPAVVAGVDGSASALQAVRWAAEEAGRRRVPLRLVHACMLIPPYGYKDWVDLLPEYTDLVFGQSRQWLAEAEEAARAAAPHVEVETDVREGVAAGVLIEESAAAGLMVVGSRGLGGFRELLVGSIAVALAAHAHCPVVIARTSTVDSPPPASGPVVVGVDGSPLSEAAVAFAFEAAAARSVPLVAVHAWLDITMAGAWLPLPSIVDWQAVETDEERLLAERLAGWQDKYPTVEVRRVLVKDRPAQALLHNAEHAQLVVVGSRGRGALLGLGSVSQAMIHHAPCPVAVIRQETS